MDALHYFRLAHGASTRDPESYSSRATVNLITNVTDDAFQKILTGLCLEQGIFPTVSAVPYKQYPFDLKNPQSAVYRNEATATFVFFDATVHKQNEFTSDPHHFDDVLQDLCAYCAAVPGTVFINTFIVPSRSAHGNLFRENPLVASIERWNDALRRFADETKNVHLVEINRIVHEMGERHVRDPRSLYAYDLPFTHDFILRVCREWVSLLRALLGKTRKCLVLDLDNTLWGGIVGEAGASGIELGTEYPGNAFVNFQRAILGLSERGILLAVNSRNNPADAMEVLEKHPHMQLREKHFSAIRINWNDKAQNLREIAEELNIGLDSLVFLDDDPVNREFVRAQLPEVLVPDFSIAPEHAVDALLSLDAFNPLRLTEEDRARGQMYAEERRRSVVRASAQSVEEYIAQLGITVDVRVNDPASIPRVAQLTQKTNQFNLTTRRHAEQDIAEMIAQDGFVFAADVADKFGAYGTTNVAIVKRTGGTTAELDTFLMSCRVIGRGVEFRFFAQVREALTAAGVSALTAWYIPTAKNEPCRDFLPTAGFALVQEGEDGSREYRLDL